METTQLKPFNVWAGRAVVVLALLMSAYHLLTTQRLLVTAFQHQMIHLGFALLLVTVGTIQTMKSGKQLPVKILFLAAQLLVIGYMFARYEHLEVTSGFVREPWDWVIGALLVIVVLEACRWAWGITFPIIALLAIAYFFVGYKLPYPFTSMQFPPDYVFSNLGIGFRGIFGTPLGVSANYVFLFVLFGGLLGAANAPRFFIEISKGAGRFIAGGVAQTAVISSALVGMVIGQAATNAVLVGSFTIPLMKNAGYTPEQAAAIEAGASAGSQIMPPIMGESVFLMAALLGMAYVDIMMASFMPAFLYFFGVALGTQVLAYQSRIAPSREKVNWQVVMQWGPLFLVPLGVIFVLLLIRFTAMYAAFWAIIAILIIPVARRATRMGFGTLTKGFASGGLAGAQIAVAIAVIGIVIQTFNTTGLGVTISQIVEMLSGGRLWLALFLAMILALVLGCGMPTLGVYAVVAVVVAPALVKMGATPLSAHLFVFWFAVISCVTPPVAFASIVTASIAKANYAKTCWIAFRVAMMGSLVPFIIVYWPILTLQPQPLFQGILGLVLLPVAMLASTTAAFRQLFTRLTIVEWLLYCIASLLFYSFYFTKVYVFPIAGLALLIPLLVVQFRKRRSLGVAGRPSTASRPI